MDIKITKSKPEAMTIDKAIFKYYLSVELDKVAEEYSVKYGGSDVITKMMNDAYFNITKRFEEYFKEIGEE